MATVFAHLDQVGEVPPSSSGREEGVRIRLRWVHPRTCMPCGHVGCSDDSPHPHAAGRLRSVGCPIIQCHEACEDWWHGDVDDLAFIVDEAPSFSCP